MKISILVLNFKFYYENKLPELQTDNCVIYLVTFDLPTFI